MNGRRDEFFMPNLVFELRLSTCIRLRHAVDKDVIVRWGEEDEGALIRYRRRVLGDG